jgi:antagonist of KipI
MILDVLDGGILTTVQDSGRPDWTHVGVPTSGAADPWSLAVANLLAGNDRGDAALEMTVIGPRLRARDRGLIALAGADLGGRVVGRRPLSVGRTHRLSPGDVVAFDGDDRRGPGARCYIGLPGGIDVPVVLGSRSTCLPGAFGGFDGRTLRTGDVIRTRRASRQPAASELMWPGANLANSGGVITLRVVGGPAPGMAELVAGSWRVSPAVDRVGIRLDGPVLSEGARGEVLTHGVPAGAIQVPPDGHPIILCADHQTTGGYPVPGVVITADLPLVGQLAPGDDVRLEPTDLAAADRALAAQERALAAGADALRDAAGWDHLASSAGG